MNSSCWIHFLSPGRRPLPADCPQSPPQSAEPGIPPSLSPPPQGYAAELDNPLMAHLVSRGLQNKKDVLFGNMEEIYHFHNRSGPPLTTPAWWGLPLRRRPQGAGGTWAPGRGLPVQSIPSSSQGQVLRGGLRTVAQMGGACGPSQVARPPAGQ